MEEKRKVYIQVLIPVAEKEAPVDARPIRTSPRQPITIPVAGKETPSVCNEAIAENPESPRKIDRGRGHASKVGNPFRDRGRRKSNEKGPSDDAPKLPDTIMPKKVLLHTTPPKCTPVPNMIFLAPSFKPPQEEMTSPRPKTKFQEPILAYGTDLHDAFLYIRTHIGHRWRDLARCLPYQHPRTLSEIEAEIMKVDRKTLGNQWEAAYFMLERWHRANGSAANIQTLCDALIDAGITWIASEVSRRYMFRIGDR